MGPTSTNRWTLVSKHYTNTDGFNLTIIFNLWLKNKGRERLSDLPQVIQEVWDRAGNRHLVEMGLSKLKSILLSCCYVLESISSDTHADNSEIKWSYWFISTRFFRGHNASHQEGAAEAEHQGHNALRQRLNLSLSLERLSDLCFEIKPLTLPVDQSDFPGTGWWLEDFHKVSLEH